MLYWNPVSRGYLGNKTIPELVLYIIYTYFSNSLPVYTQLLCCNNINIYIIFLFNILWSHFFPVDIVRCVRCIKVPAWIIIFLIIQSNVFGRRHFRVLPNNATCRSHALFADIWRQICAINLIRAVNGNGSIKAPWAFCSNTERHEYCMYSYHNMQYASRRTEIRDELNDLFILECPPKRMWRLCMFCTVPCRFCCRPSAA